MFFSFIQRTTMNKIRLLAICFILLIFSVSMAAGDLPEYRGKLNPELSSGGGRMLMLNAASAEQIAQLPLRPGEGDEVFAGALTLVPKTDVYQILVVAPNEGAKYFYIDLNRNEKFEADERIALSDKGEAEFSLPVSIGMFKAIPGKLAYREMKAGGGTMLLTAPVASVAQDSKAPAAPTAPSSTVNTTSEKQAGEEMVFAIPMVQPGAKGTAESAPSKVTRTLTITLNTMATAIVDIGGQKTLFQYNVDLQGKKIDPLQGSLAVDCNGNGKIDATHPSNVERATARGTPLVFRVGTHYIATRAVDVNTGAIIIESHPASDYTRIEMLLGTQIPDFPFKDINGKAYTLADFRGKYLLLDFWGSW
jgi:hypothetical protein